MQNIALPPFVDNVLSALETAGYEAYAVGGCCRDRLLGRIPQDWDVCTSAMPEDVLRVFPYSIPTGLKHGTVTVRTLGERIEVTTFRIDGAYHDHRRPDSVRFTGSLFSDLSRRDFTMNALAMDRCGKITDYFGGEADIRAGVIRCVGDAEIRFSEDALRMFRAIRFSAQLGFELDAAIPSAMARLTSTASLIAAERVQAETRKALLSPRPENLALGIELGLFDRYLCPGRPVNLSPLRDIPLDPLMRFGAFCALLRQSGRIGLSANFLSSLRCDSRTIRAVSQVLDPEPVWLRETSLAAIAAAVGRKFSPCAAAAMQVSGIDHAVENMRRLLNEDRCLAVSELDITGKELKRLGFFGSEIGKCLLMLLRHVLVNPEDNKNATLITLAKNSRGH
ncbi:MAG: CCA tRNA nucleotidyltransferase [Oscillospiraceae bacterium]